MAHPKFKSENYNQMGGINSKISPYLTGPLEFLDIKNYDFQMVGALSQRWGSTMYIGQTWPNKISHLVEFSKLNGQSYLIVGSTGGVWYGATTGQAQGMSFSYFGITQSQQGTSFTLQARGLDFVYVGANSDLVGQIRSLALNGDINQLTSSNMIVPNWVPTKDIQSSVVFQNYLYATDGDKMFRFDGTTTVAAQLIPPAIDLNSYVTWTSTVAGNVHYIMGATGSYYYQFSLVNNRGVEGPRWPLVSINANVAGATAAALGGTYLAMGVYVNFPESYGISAINLYSFHSGVTVIAINNPAVWSFPYVFNRTIPNSGSTATLVELGTTNIAGVQAFMDNSLSVPEPNNYIALGLSLTYQFPNLTGGLSAMAIGSYTPRYLEIYQNRLFMAGFSSTPSTVWFSDTGEPEGVEADWNFEVRTNDADYVTAMKAYSTRLYIFKTKSFFILTGDNPDNFFLQQVSGLYGCINQKCAVVYNDLMLFLDRKGVILYNGANIQFLSDKVQPIFDRMNYSAALTEACATHDLRRNQILFGIPVDGSSVNNLTVVYDYVAQAWTTYTGFSPSYFAQVQGRNSTVNTFYGNYSGMVNWMGASFITDNGVGATLYFKTRFLHDMGQSVEKQFRRLYINTDDVSATLTFPVNFYQDYGSSIVKAMTIVVNEFQQRIDFGIPAKSLAFELYYLPSNSPLRLYGFTIESRFQRNT